SPTEQHGTHRSAAFPSLPLLSGEQLLSDQSGLALLPATEGIRHPLSVTVCEPGSMATSVRPNGLYLPSATMPLLPKAARPPSPTCSSTPPSLNLNQMPRPRKQRDSKPKMKKLKYHQYIPPDQRGTAGLRQHLRKRGLPVSGTKPALLQRLRPFQLPQPCVPPVPLCQLGISTETLPTSLSPNQSPISSASSGSDSPSQCPSKHIYIHNRKIPNGIVSDAPSGILSDIPNAFTNATSVSLAGEPCTMFLAPASTASGTPSPSLPMSSSSPLQCGTPWRTETEQQQQQREELNVELEMRERMKSRPRDHLNNSSELSRGGALHPFLQQDSGCSTEKPRNEEELFTLYCCQPCDVIGQDFELPVQITASPVQSSPAVRSLEEELQEAIQKAQMDPRQSLDDILDAPSHSPLPQSDQLQPKDDSFLPSPLCSSLLLEMPPSPAVIPQSQVIPAPPPPPLCTSPLPLNRKSRKRRAPPPFDAAEWLETLTCGLLTPPTAPFVEPDFSLDSDLNVNRVLDLMIEQW
uniref:SAP domain-containing protein n=1 Tax=Periophthalmus magnuspinnatus TaxID=409849 RepID=A0A3B4ACM9_9GOBI